MSSVVPLQSSSCQSPDLVLPRPFPSVLTTMAFDHSRRRWFGTCSCKPVPGGHPPSVRQLHTSGPPRPLRSWRTIIGIPDQHPERRTACRADPIPLIQVDVGQQWRDHPALRCPRQRFSHRAILHHSPPPAIGVLTSILFDPRFVLSPVPSTCFCRCCRSSPECPRPRQNCGPGCPPRGSLPVPVSRSSSGGTHNCRAENPLRRSARSPASPPFEQPGPEPSVSQVAAAFRLLSVSIAASPVKDDIGLPSDRPVSLRETVSLPAPRWIAAWFHPRLPLLCYCVPASTLPTGRHSCESGRTARENAVSYSSLRTPIACAGVVVLFHRGYWSLLTCPRTYLLTGPIKAGSLPSGAFCCTPSPVLRTPRTPSRLRALSAFRLYMPVFARHGCRGGSLSCSTIFFWKTCHRPLPRKGPAFPPVLRSAVCCLRRDMTGSALSNTFRLTI